jgi:hypothetical protein
MTLAKQKLFQVLLGAVILSSLGCSGNLLSPVAVTTSNDALYFAAQEQMDSRNYGAAISDFQAMTPAYLAKRNVADSYASAYSGACGLDLINLANQFSNIGNKTLMALLLSANVGTTAAAEANCVTAQNMYNALSAPMSSTEDLELAFTSFIEMGSILEQYADPTGTGTASTSFNPCSTTDFPDAEARKFAASLMMSLTAITASGSSLLGGSVSVINTLCTTMTGILGANPCLVTSPSAFTANEMKAINGLIKTTTVGIGTCSDSTFVTCVCP